MLNSYPSDINLSKNYNMHNIVINNYLAINIDHDVQQFFLCLFLS